MGLFSKQSTTDGSQQSEKPSERTLATTILQTSLVDAQLLMMTAAERGIELDAEVTQTILETSDALDKSRLTPENINSFWHAYDSLSRTLSPITIDSVRATHDMRRLRSGIWGYLQGRIYVPFSRKSAFRYKMLSLTTLLSLIALQVFWSIGNTLVIDIKDQSDQIIMLEEQLFSENNTSSPNGSLNSFPKSNGTATNEEGETEGETTAAPEARTAPGRKVDIQALNHQIGEYIAWRSAEIIELKNWNRFWGRIIFFSEQTWEKPDYNDLSPESKIHVHYVSAQYVLHAISVYFLPILYGLLGASFYVLRQLPKDIENLTFSMNSHIDYSLRITQGPLAGIMASFFFTEAPSKFYSLTSHSSAIATIKLGSSSLANFSPLAIAFLAGYSVELIFYVIDKIISTVTTRSTATAVKPTPQPVKMTSPAKPAKPANSADS
ncbi:hypothetical protein [Sneathiella sp.]|uniref:hypothetical protein n=1 Tax=Sneathiella sp. TaxID=1964365 RepID=UPI0026024E99|nr:hypothetical protein [Sneathiella sp.]MDF2367325.1 hypothetical protein [Sneathiella sp.]